MSSRAVEAARGHAEEALRLRTIAKVPRDNIPGVRMAMGDPQAPFTHVLEILDRFGLLNDQGTLHRDVQLVSIGDHFDWGEREDRDRASSDGVRLLSWLAAHPPDQAVILAGNHDLARVGELAGFTDATFKAAQEIADIAYPNRLDDRGLQALLRARAPTIPTPELLSRDFSSFTEGQRDLIVRLLEARPLRVALPMGASLLLIHAGVTIGDLNLL